jgi:hypothetical protein
MESPQFHKVFPNVIMQTEKTIRRMPHEFFD